MIPPKEAERRAHQLIEEYVNGAGCTSVEDIANVLTKLASLTGLAIAAVAGREHAVKRLEQCAANTASAVVAVPAASFDVRGTPRPH